MAAKLTRLAYKIAIQQHLVAESCTICSSRLQAASPETFGYTLVLCPCVVNTTETCVDVETNFTSPLKGRVSVLPRSKFQLHVTQHTVV